MAKTHGIGARLFVGGYDISGDIGAVNRIASPRTVLDVTDITQSAPERRLALKDGGIDFTSWFNPSVGRAHDVLSDLPTTDTLVTYMHRATVGVPAASMVAKQIGYDPSRTQDGALSISVATVSNAYGLEWGVTMTAGTRTDTSATNGTGQDFGASSAFGLQAYLHVVAFTGTSVTVKLQESSDNAVGDPYADVTGGAFAAASAVGWQRIATSNSQTVERYLRIVTTGTFSNAQFAVIVVRNSHSGVVF